MKRRYNAFTKDIITPLQKTLKRLYKKRINSFVTDVTTPSHFALLRIVMTFYYPKGVIRPFHVALSYMPFSRYYAF